MAVPIRASGVRQTEVATRRVVCRDVSGHQMVWVVSGTVYILCSEPMDKGHEGFGDELILHNNSSFDL